MRSHITHAADRPLGVGSSPRPLTTNSDNSNSAPRTHTPRRLGALGQLLDFDSGFKAVRVFAGAGGGQAEQRQSEAEISRGSFHIIQRRCLDVAPQHICWCSYVPNPFCQARVTTAEPVFFWACRGGILYLRVAVVPPIRTFFSLTRHIAAGT
jgi:hypothetical protein